MNIDADYDTLPLDVANDCNQELIRAFNIFGTVGIVNGVKVDNEQVTGNTFAAYDPKTFTILLRSDRNRADVARAMRKAGKGYFSTRSHLHPYRHEFGHALWEYLKRLDADFVGRMSKMYDVYFEECRNGKKTVASECSETDALEMFSEAIADLMDRNPSARSTMIIDKSEQRY